MCCCKRPSINGESNAYSWDGKTFTTRPIYPPATEDGDEILADEPGRCGGIDAHSHHFRVVRARFGGFFLLVRHGGGDERIPIGHRAFIVEALDKFDSNGRYWLLHSIYNVQNDSARKATELEANTWRKAAAEKRIRTRKQPSRGFTKVWIEAAQAS